MGDSEEHGQSKMVTEETDTVGSKQIVFLISDGPFDWNSQTGHLRQGVGDQLLLKQYDYCHDSARLLMGQDITGGKTTRPLGMGKVI